MNPSPTRSVVESRNAPNGVAFLLRRASAPSRMSRIDPIVKSVAPIQYAAHLVAVLEVDDDAGDDAERDSGRRQRVGRDARARQAFHRARGETAHSDRVALLEAPEPFRAAHGVGYAGAGDGSRETIRRSSRRLTTAAATPATAMPARMSSQKWLPVAMTANQTHAGQSEAERLQPERPDEEGEGDADDQRIRGMQARHGRIRIRAPPDDPALVADRKPGEAVDEAEVGEHPRRRRRHEDVADEPDQVRQDQRVPHPLERLVPAQVDPEQDEPEDGELRLPVRPRGQGQQQARTSGRSSGATAPRDR